MTALADKLKARIHEEGSICVSSYMQSCLLDRTHGYYHHKPVLGVAGDFITAPEISQIFGEMLAAYLMHIHTIFGAEEDVICFEAGGGRGTLASDMQRSYQQLCPALAGAPLYLFEDSPAMQAAQSQKLNDKALHFIADVTALPAKPIFGVANEFFDALGVEQAIYQNGVWHQRRIGLKHDDFTFITGVPLSPDALAEFAPLPDAPEEGDIIEKSALSVKIMSSLAAHIAHYGGALLIIDYGKADNCGDSLQAVRDHKPADLLSHQGEADITHWVDFNALANTAKAAQARLIGPVPQGRFLTEIGIGERAEALRQKDNPEQDRALLAALDRLISPAQMGHAFKVALLVPQGEGLPPGFLSLTRQEPAAGETA